MAHPSRSHHKKAPRPVAPVASQPVALEPLVRTSLRAIAPMLHQYPDLMAELRGTLDRADARERANGLALVPMTGATTLSKAAPTGSTPLAGASVNFQPLSKDAPQGIQNARLLRMVARDPWVQAAIMRKKQQIGRANLAVLPMDERKKYDKGVLAEVERLFRTPNELLESWRSIQERATDDILTIDRGAISKNNDLQGRPHALYAEDGATIKIYPAWDGDPKKPRYLFEEEMTGRKVPLLNNQLICIQANEASYRYGLGNVQILLETIEADIEAMRSAKGFASRKPPPVFIQIPGMTQNALDLLRNRYETEVAGRYETLFLGGDQKATVEKLTYSARDNQWLEWQEFLVRKICAVFQISPQDLGLTMDINRANGEVQQELTLDGGIIPLMLLWEEYLNMELLGSFAPRDKEGRPDLVKLNLRIIYPEISEISRMLHASRTIGLLRQAAGPSAPLLTPNMWMEMLGQEPFPSGGNTLYWGTGTGPIPFLSYDDDLGSFTPMPATSGELGALDPAGGPAEEAAGDTTAGDNAPVFNSADETGASEAATPGPASDLNTGKALSEWQWRLKAASDGHTSTMVAFFLDKQTAAHLALPGYEAPEDLHVTLALLGDVSERSAADLKRLRKELAAFAAEQPPLDGVIAGLGRFSAPAGEPTPVVALPDIPGLPAWREALVQRLAALGFPASEQHGYTPHVTLAYIDADAPMPISEVPRLPLSFPQVWLATGDERSSYDLHGEPATPAKHLRPLSQARASRLARVDRRMPGKAWTPALDREPLALPLVKAETPQPRGTVPAPIANASSRPLAEQQAREQTRARVAAIFEQALQRGQARA